MERIRSLLLAAFAIGAATSPTIAEPSYKLNRAQTAAIELSNLTSGGVCLDGDLDGRVVAVTYNARGTLPTGFTIEHADRTRSFINVDEDEFQNASRLAQGWVADGLQRMVREGKRVELGVQFCGAAGRVIMLESIRAR